jgi:BlaI family transcriptional regulator, penicillinase repressor
MKRIASQTARKNQKLPSISEAEWVVMKIVWQQNIVTANQVVEALTGQTDWKPKTIHTLLRRLTCKGALAHEKRGREFHFRPLVDARNCVYAASKSFLNRFFDGRIAPFLACFLERKRLSRAEVEELRRMLDQMPS